MKLTPWIGVALLLFSTASVSSENVGPGYTRFDTVRATGTATSPNGAVSNVIDIASDDLNAEGSGSGAYYSA